MTFPSVQNVTIAAHPSLKLYRQNVGMLWLCPHTLFLVTYPKRQTIDDAERDNVISKLPRRLNLVLVERILCHIHIVGIRVNNYKRVYLHSIISHTMLSHVINYNYEGSITHCDSNHPTVVHCRSLNGTDSCESSMNCTVAELIMADVTNKRLHAFVLHHMSVKAVRRRKDATTDVTGILVVPNGNRKVPLQPTGSRDMFAAFGAANIVARCVTQARA